MNREAMLSSFAVLLEAGEGRSVVVQGTSMHPFLRAGDTVHLRHIRPEALRLGDLMAFRQGGALIVHRFAGRVFREGGLRLRQKGDHQRGFGEIAPEDLIGRVDFIEARGRIRPQLQGMGRWGNRLRGLGAWAFCAAWSTARRLVRWGRTWTRRGGEPLMEAPLSPEERLLFLASRLVLTPDDTASVLEILEAGIRWPLLLRDAEAFKILPLLHHHFSAPGFASLVPQDTAQVLAQAYRRCSLKNLQIHGSLRKILVGMREAGIPVILLKGAYLATQVYGDIGLRPMSDLDLLCRKEDEPRIWELLKRLGARPSMEKGGFNNATDERVVEHTSHAPPWVLDRVARIEIHYHLLAGNLPDDRALQQALWEQASTHEWEGLEIRSLGLEHQVLHLAVHLHKHALEERFALYWVSDLRELLRARGPSLDGQALSALARELGYERELRDVMVFLGEEARLGACLPGPSRLSFGTLLRSRESGSARGLGRLSKLRGVRMAGGAWDQVRFLGGLAFPRRAKMAARHPSAGPLGISLWYLADPFLQIACLMRGLGHHVQQRLRP